MSDIIGFNNIANSIKNNLLTDKSDILVFAYNATGKTRISRELSTNENELNTLCYNAVFEDCFIWNNEDNILNINTNNLFFKTVEEEGLYKEGD